MTDRAAYTSSCPVCFMISKNSLNVAKSRDTTVLPFYILLRIPLCIVRCPVTETVPVRSQTALFLQRPSSRLPRRHPKLPFEGTDKRRFMLKATVICDIADPFLRIVQQFPGFLKLLSSDILRQRNAIILLKYRLQIGRRQVDMLCNLLNGQLLCQIVSYIGKNIFKYFIFLTHILSHLHVGCHRSVIYISLSARAAACSGLIQEKYCIKIMIASEQTSACSNLILIIICLLFKHRRIFPAKPHQFLMTSLFNDPSILKHINPIRIPCCG